MRKNTPVVNKEYELSEGTVLISRTDARGVIQEANDSFVTTSGFKREDLIGQPHNIVRHPDMPPAVFQWMWRTLKSGQVWTGVVKNRRANGEYYWVRANATPVWQGNEIVGYTSVRTLASRAEIAEAEDLYASLNASGKSIPVTFVDKVAGTTLKRFNLTAIGAVLSPWLALGLMKVLFPGLAGIDHYIAMGLVGLFTFGSGLVVWKLASRLKKLSRTLSIVQGTGNLAVEKMQGGADEAGQAGMALNALISMLKGAVSDSQSNAERLSRTASGLSKAAENLRLKSAEQSSSIESMAAAVEEFSVSISSVADRTDVVDEKAEETVGLCEQGSASLHKLMDKLSETESVVRNSADAMESFRKISEDIAVLTELVGQIAEQNNLLALNAAIEAARAGEAGRGFAVVADEVRNQAQRTGEAASKIQDLARRMNSESGNLHNAVMRSVQSIEESEADIEKVSMAFTDMRESALQVQVEVAEISAATKEQSMAGQEIARRVETVSQAAEASVALATDVSRATEEIASTAEFMTHGSVIAGFKA